MDAIEYFSDLPPFLSDLEAFIRLESPSRDRAALEKAALWIDQAFGPGLERQDTPAGPLLTWRGGSQRGRRTLLLCHYDTVHPAGALSFQVQGQRASGPGVYDMKGNIVMLRSVLRAASALGRPLPPLTALFTPDEEVGSRASRAAIEAEAERHDAVLVLEGPMSNGDPKVARKGVGLYRLEVQGLAAHQGVEPELGANAIVELARQILAVQAMEDRELGTTLGPNLAAGGTATNVVAARAWLEVDLRVWSAAEADRVDAALRVLRPQDARIRLQWSGGLNRPPMEPSEASLGLFRLLQEVGARLGLELHPGRVGGGSDGNFTAALGRPTLDGLGLVGEAAHQPGESIFLDQVPVRSALLLELLAALAQG